MSNVPFRSDQVVEELVQFNQNLSKPATKARTTWSGISE